MSKDIFKLLTENFKSFETMNKNGNIKLICSPEHLGKELSDKYNVYKYESFIIIRKEDKNTILEYSPRIDNFYYILTELFSEDASLDYSLYCNMDTKLPKKTKITIDKHLKNFDERLLKPEDKLRMNKSIFKKTTDIPKGILEYFSKIDTKIHIRTKDLKRLFREKYKFTCGNVKFGMIINECCTQFDLSLVKSYTNSELYYDIYKREQNIVNS